MHKYTRREDEFVYVCAVKDGYAPHIKGFASKSLRFQVVSRNSTHPVEGRRRRRVSYFPEGSICTLDHPHCHAHALAPRPDPYKENPRSTILYNIPRRNTCCPPQLLTTRHFTGINMQIKLHNNRRRGPQREQLSDVIKRYVV